ncbi:kinesin light chain 1 [Lecanosticta acicola]|uniref:Kinesin light chain 1 n=1 Tax=Lecanosticta acicola TaxID=111012 RepID=A0AAI8YYB5_9PEZI|nr:kinesin light chain 1 [Lecanosticta acicola]
MNLSGNTFGSVTVGDNARAHLGNIYNRHISEPTPKRAPVLLVPFRKDKNFVGREEVLDNIEECLSVDGYHNRVALTGLGGVGKSQIAIQYSYRHHAKHPEDWVFWVYAGSRERFIESYRNIAIQTGIVKDDDANVNYLRVVKNWLCDRNKGRWLLVIDSADDNELFVADGGGEARLNLRQSIPESEHGAVLITSRNITGPDLAGDIDDVLRIGPFEESTALQLMRMKVPSFAEDIDGKQLVSTLEYIPLALTQAAAYINRNQVSVQYYLQRFQQEEQQQVELLGKDWNDLRRDATVSNPVLTTWRMTYDQLVQSHRLAAQLLARMALLERQCIPEILVLRMRNDAPDNDRVEAMGTLLQYGLCTQLDAEQGYTMHRLVQVCTKAWLRKAGVARR